MSGSDQARRLDFIFMLTRHDRTVTGALAHVEAARRAGVRHVGFKDVGLPLAALRDLAQAISGIGATSYLEVVSLDRDSELASAAAALELGVDYLLGGTRAADVLPLIAGAALRYYPFPGRISGHPSVLEGEIADIVSSALELAALDGVSGLDLLAYRSRHDGAALTRAVCRAVAKPVIVAGSIAHPDQIEAVRRGAAAGFTIGTAALEGRFPARSAALADQLTAIAAACAATVD